MSKDWKDTVLHAQFNAQGLATMGVCPEWDRAVHNLIAADVLARAHEEFGPLELAHNDHERERMTMESRLGKYWREHPEGKPVWDRLCEVGSDYDRLMTEQFYNSLWNAQRQLALTPAPTLAAALYKASVIEMHDVWNDAHLDVQCIDLIEADLARLATAKGETA